MSIPKTIYQTFKTSKLPLITRWHIYWFRKKNPEYDYQFYDDTRIEQFIEAYYDRETLTLYQQINIGAAKADFFRYAILYKLGGIYLDIDSASKTAFRKFLLPNDEAVISKERNADLYVQWALIFRAGHPFLEKTMDLMLNNLRNNTYPNDVHQMTGPSVYTKAINSCLEQDPNTPHRVLGTDYQRHLRFKYTLSKLLYAKGDHWKQIQLTRTVMK